MSISSAFRNTFLIGGSFVVVLLGTVLYYMRPSWAERILYFGAFGVVAALWWKHVNVPSGKVVVVLGVNNRPTRMLYPGRHGLLPFVESVLHLGNEAFWDLSAGEFKLTVTDRDGNFEADVKVVMAPRDPIGLVEDLLVKGNPNFPFVCDYDSPQAFLSHILYTAVKQYLDMAANECGKQLKTNDNLDLKDDRVLRTKLQQSLDGKQQSWSPKGDLKSNSRLKPYWLWTRITSVELLTVTPTGAHKRPGVPITPLAERLRTLLDLQTWAARELNLDLKQCTANERIALQSNATRIFDSLQFNSAEIGELMPLHHINGLK